MVKVAFWASVLIYAASILAGIRLLPDTVPSHFDFSGQPDSWSSRSSFLVALGAIGVGVAAIFGAISLLLDRLPMSLLNIPNKQWWTATEERTARLKQMIVADSYFLGTATMLMLSGLLWLTIRAARLPEPHLDWLFTLVFGGWLVVVLAWTGWTIAFRYRPDPAG